MNNTLPLIPLPRKSEVGLEMVKLVHSGTLLLFVWAQFCSLGGH